MVLYTFPAKLMATCLLVLTISGAKPEFASAGQNFSIPPLTTVDTPGDGEYGKADITKIRIYVYKDTFNVEATIKGLGRADEITMSLNSSLGNYMYINQEFMGNRYSVYKKCNVTVKSNRNITLTVPLHCLPGFARNKPIAAIVHLVEGPIYPEVAYTIIDSVYTDSFVIPLYKRK